MKPRIVNDLRTYYNSVPLGIKVKIKQVMTDWAIAYLRTEGTPGPIVMGVDTHSIADYEIGLYGVLYECWRISATPAVIKELFELRVAEARKKAAL